MMTLIYFLIGFIVLYTRFGLALNEKITNLAKANNLQGYVLDIMLFGVIVIITWPIFLILIWIDLIKYKGKNIKDIN
jgi:hypothetical protein